MVFLDSFQVHPHLLQERLHLLGPGSDAALQGGLCRGCDLRQPAAPDVGHGELGGAAYEVVLPDERVVLLGGLLALLQRVRSPSGLRVPRQPEKLFFSFDSDWFGFHVAKLHYFESGCVIRKDE